MYCIGKDFYKVKYTENKNITFVFFNKSVLSGKLENCFHLSQSVETQEKADLDIPMMIQLPLFYRTASLLQNIRDSIFYNIISAQSLIWE